MPNQPEVRIVIVSKLTSKSQTTIPQPIRAVLGLQPGDELAYEIVDVPVANLKLAGLPVPSLIRSAKDSDARRV